MKRAILFLNLGGPENQDEVKPFLYRLFVDPEIIRIPFTPLRMFVAWLISTLRAEKSKALYREIGGGSPIRRYTDEQAREVEKRLEGKNVVVRTAFSCSNPLIEDVISDLCAQGVEKFMSLPLYPQYSYTTTKGALDRVRKALKKFNPPTEVRSYPTHPLFIEAHADLIRKELDQFSIKDAMKIHIVFSAHSIPEKLVTELGDPYKKEVEETCSAVAKKLEWTGPIHVAWQSKLGPVKWLAPATADVVVELGRKGVKHVLVVPIAFVTDHIETLEELDKELKEEAEEAGVAEYRRVPGLNSHPLFMQCLAEIALDQKAFWND